MISLAEQWRIEDKKRRAPDSVEHWNMRSATYAKGAHSEYVEAFIRNMKLTRRNLILDMGCGTGSLAIPLAQLGHGVIAADFSSGMLERLRKAAQLSNVMVLEAHGNISERLSKHPTGGFIIPVLMSWEDDWHSFGLNDNLVDIALASRSIITHDLEDSLRKLSSAASHKVCVTVGTGISPRVDPVVAQAMGIQLDKHNDALFVFGIAHELGFEPEVTYIHSPRTRLYTSRDEAYHALLETMNYVDDKDTQVDPQTAAQRLRDWLLVHLVPAKEKGMWCLDKPHIVPWAFITWEV